MKMRLIDKLKKMVFCVGFIFALLTATTYAQGIPGPPSFPESPAPAPIDGGLGLLAAAGGAYAWKKLKNKKKEEDTIDL